MAINFDREVDRLGTHCVKWEFIREGDEMMHGDHADPRHGSDRMLPMWVADMDFCSPQPVLDALVARAQQGVFGYSKPTPSYYEAVLGWHQRRYGRRLEREWLVLTPGVVPAINMMVQAYTEPGDKVLLQRPVYFPFFNAIELNDRQIVSNALRYEEGRYSMDFDDLARQAADPGVKMAILCSPHNPVGRVWTAAELQRFGQICLENDVLVISDEIHCDLIYSHAAFTPFDRLDKAWAQKSILCTAPSKSFNLAGLKTSNIIIRDERLRQKLEAVMERNGMFGSNTFGLVAVEAAYNHGEAWLAEVMVYVEANYHFMARYVAEHLPQLHVVRPEGTYLVWVDFEGLGLSAADRRRLLLDQARVLPDEGPRFGPEGEHFERFNIACPRSILAEALHRIKEVVERMPAPAGL